MEAMCCRQKAAPGAQLEQCVDTVAVPARLTTGDLKPANFCIKDVPRNFLMFKASPTNLRAVDFGCSQFLGQCSSTERRPQSA